MKCDHITLLASTPLIAFTRHSSPNSIFLSSEIYYTPLGFLTCLYLWGHSLEPEKPTTGYILKEEQFCLHQQLLTTGNFSVNGGVL